MTDQLRKAAQALLGHIRDVDNPGCMGLCAEWDALREALDQPDRCVCGHRDINHSDIDLYQLLDCYQCDCKEYQPAPALDVERLARALVDSAVLVPVEPGDDDDECADEVWAVHPDPLAALREALAQPAPAPDDRLRVLTASEWNAVIDVLHTENFDDLADRIAAALAREAEADR